MDWKWGNSKRGTKLMLTSSFLNAQYVIFATGVSQSNNLMMKWSDVRSMKLSSVLNNHHCWWKTLFSLFDMTQAEMFTGEVMFLSFTYLICLVESSHADIAISNPNPENDML